MRTQTKWLPILLTSTLLGSAFQPGLGCLGRVARNVNPCGTILVCDPLEYDLLFNNENDWPNWDVDPTCTIPGFCGNTPFPPSTGGGVGVPVTPVP